MGGKLLDAAGPVGELWVLEENARARAFYERRGWRWNGESKRLYGVTELRYAKVPAVPPPEVLAEFGATDSLLPLSGGTTGTCYRSGGLVLKPGQNEEVVAWLADLVEAIGASEEFRLSRPVRSRSGAWTLAGWAAYVFVEGGQESERWGEMLRAGRALHRAIADLLKPRFLERRTDRWAVGDRAAWGEIEVPIPAGVRDQIDQLSELLAPVDVPSQVVHSDLCGNTLLHERLQPAIIDFSALYRPAGYAEAILVSDAFIWESAQMDLVEDWMRTELDRQMLIRACLFRLFTAALGWPHLPERLAIISEHHRPLTDWLRQQARTLPKP